MQLVFFGKIFSQFKILNKILDTLTFTHPLKSTLPPPNPFYPSRSILPPSQSIILPHSTKYSLPPSLYPHIQSTLHPLPQTTINSTQSTTLSQTPLPSNPPYHLPNSTISTSTITLPTYLHPPHSIHPTPSTPLQPIHPKLNLALHPNSTLPNPHYPSPIHPTPKPTLIST